jgi:hypothetical protein
VAVEEVPDLFSGQAVGRSLQSLADAIGNGVSDAGSEEGGGGGGTVVPRGEGSLEVGQLDDRAAVESSVESAQAQHLCFGAAGGCAVETSTVLAQGRVVVVPEFASGLVAAKEDFRLALHPLDGAPEVASDGCRDRKPLENRMDRKRRCVHALDAWLAGRRERRSI